MGPVVQHDPPERGIARGNRGDSGMKKLLLVGAALMAFGGSALAADVRRPAYTPPPAPPPAPVYSWTGLYWGGNIGYSWGEAKRDFTVSGLGTASGSQDIDGVIGGFQTGYNYQFGTWVWASRLTFRPGARRAARPSPSLRSPRSPPTTNSNGLGPPSDTLASCEVRMFWPTERSALRMARSRIAQRSLWPTSGPQPGPSRT